MKTLKIDTEILGFNKEPIPDVTGKTFTIKSVLLQCVGAFFTSPNAEENIEANRLGNKLYDSKGTIELEDAEFKLLQKGVNKVLQDQRFSAVLMAPVLELFKD